MTSSLIILAAIAAVPIAVAFIWRVNSMLLFTSVAVGDLLVRYLGDDAAVIVSSFYKHTYSETGAKIALLFLPVALTLLFGRRSLSKTKTFLHLVPIVATGVVLALLTLPLLSAGFQGAVYSSPIGNTIKQVHDLAIAGAGVASLLVAWISNATQKEHHGKHKH